MATTTAKDNGSPNGGSAATASTAAPEIQIDRIAEEALQVPIVGVSPLVVCRFPEKAKAQMLHAAQGKHTPKTPKDPQAEYLAAFHRLRDGGYGFPADGFKQATVGAGRFYGKAVTMTALKQFIFIGGELGADGRLMVTIDTPEPLEEDLDRALELGHCREDVVRVGRGGSDLRYRPQFWPWSATLQVRYFKAVLTRESVLSLIDAGGLAVGVGEWRPERDGTFGTYRIDPDREVEVLNSVGA